MFATLLGRLRFVAILEGISYLLIFAVGMPMKYFLDSPMPNKVIGMIHGVLFILYVVMTIQAKIKFNWTDRKTVLALVASLLPFGAFWAEQKLFKEGGNV